MEPVEQYVQLSMFVEDEIAAALLEDSAPEEYPLPPPVRPGERGPGVAGRRVAPALVCFTGDREAEDNPELRADIKEALDSVKARYRPVMVMHGDCRGVDKIAGDVAKRMKLIVTPYPYREELGRAGGPARNRDMVSKLVEHRDRGGYALVIAIHPDLERSKGTKNMISQSLAAGIEVLRLHSGEE
jgi:hypothetical protein